jgi:WbqC-like protein family
MPRTAVITQPTYLPWLGYFEQIARADTFVYLDTVQFVRRYWHSRNRLKDAQDNPLWLTVPVKAHAQKTPLLEMQISRDRPDWSKQHLATIQTCLGSSPYFSHIFPSLQELLSQDYQQLVDLNIAGIELFAKLLGLSPHFVRSSSLNPIGTKTELLVDLCQQVKADCYYSSLGAKVYMETAEHLFSSVGIEVIYQAWEHPIYPQKGNQFVSHLSIVDVLMNIGIEATRDFIIDSNLT